MNWLAILKLVGPFVIAFIPKLLPVAPQILDAMANAEQVPGAKGADKKARVLAVAHDAIQVANQVQGKQLPADELVAAADKGIDAVVAVVNAIHAVKGL